MWLVAPTINLTELIEKPLPQPLLESVRSWRSWQTPVSVQANPSRAQLRSRHPSTKDTLAGLMQIPGCIDGSWPQRIHKESSTAFGAGLPVVRSLLTRSFRQHMSPFIALIYGSLILG